MKTLFATLTYQPVEIIELDIWLHIVQIAPNMYGVALEEINSKLLQLTDNQYLLTALDRYLNDEDIIVRFINDIDFHIISLDTFRALLIKLSRAGNLNAGQILAKVSFNDLLTLVKEHFQTPNCKHVYSDEPSTTKHWGDIREDNKASYWALWSAIDKYIQRHDTEVSDNYKQYTEVNCQKLIDRKLLGKEAKQLRKVFNLDDIEAVRDNVSILALERIEIIQRESANWINNADLEPYQAVKTVLSIYNFPTVVI